MLGFVSNPVRWRCEAVAAEKAILSDGLAAPSYSAIGDGLGRPSYSAIGTWMPPVLTVIACLLVAVSGRGDDPVRRNDLLHPGTFIQIPGPNPILQRGKAGAWDDGVIEASDALKDRGTYYLFYHATGRDQGYQLGVATAPGPLGPFEKHGTEPVLKLGPKGSWDDRHVACAMILREGIEKYTMWYSGLGSSREHSEWSVGLATASHPAGPWKKHADNPVLEDFGYVGGVVKVRGKYHLYTAHRIGSTGPDYSPMALATADSATGPWRRYAKNPVLRAGEPGEWDDGGFSEAEVFYSGGVFHMFYGGAHLFPERIRTRECIGYAYSFDGMNFTKHGRNPIATREANPNAAAFAEVHAIYEPPFIYLYHTLRYKQPRNAADKPRFPGVEDLGVQVLATSTPFRLAMPVLQCKKLTYPSRTSLADCPPICLSGTRRASLTLEYTLTEKSEFTPYRPGLIVLTSHDGIHYDTQVAPVGGFQKIPAEVGRGQYTVELDTSARFIKVQVITGARGTTFVDLKVTATLGG